jgi:hypothetical protein
MAFTRLKNGNIPEMNVLISVCIAFEIDVQNTLTQLNSAGYSFKMTDRVHYAYYFLITNYSGRNISECNEILIKIGIAEKHLLRENSK